MLDVKYPFEYFDPYKWNYWFAWYPVQLTGSKKTVWCCWVERRLRQSWGDGPYSNDTWDWWEYRSIT